MTGYAWSDVDKRKWASMLLLLFEAHTVQNFNLKGDSEVVGGGAGAIAGV